MNRKVKSQEFVSLRQTVCVLHWLYLLQNKNIHHEIIFAFFLFTYSEGKKGEKIIKSGIGCHSGVSNPDKTIQEDAPV